MSVPGMGGVVGRPDDFPEARYLRVGAGPRQLQKLKDAWLELSYEERVAENIKIASLPDSELGAKMKLPATPDVVPGAQPAESLGEAGTQPAPSKDPTEQPR